MWHGPHWADGYCVVPIRAFLEGPSFSAEAINAMSLAFDGACDALGLHPTVKDPATSLVAEKLIHFAMAGVHDAQALRTLTLKQLSEDNAQAPNRTGLDGPRRGILLRQLAMAERHIAVRERYIARQHGIVAELERHGHGGSQTVKVAWEVLQSFKMAQAIHLVDRERLKRALGA
jgi:hypothetical protein